jgi:di/tripeptidase
LSDLIHGFVDSAEAKVASEHPTRCSYNFGVIEGGASINSIPASARAKLDLRSEDAQVLDELAALLNPTMERSLEKENRGVRSGRLTAKIKELGSRPGGRLDPDAYLLRTVQAVDSYLAIRSRMHCASTDANVPLSLGLPAISIGAGGMGGGAHTPNEWYQPDGRDLGLRRILLTLVALAAHEPAELAFQPGK